MTVAPSSGPARALAGRLRELREKRFPDVRITQRALGEALGGASAPLISSWEKGLATPSPNWLARYAALFASDRSVDDGSIRLLRGNDLTRDEQAVSDSLFRELIDLREQAVRAQQTSQMEDPRQALGGSWYFRDGNPVRIVCAERPKEQQRTGTTPVNPTRAYGELYSFSNIDALFELFGHIRAANPRIDVQVREHSKLNRDDHAAHLVVLGGIDWNPLMRRVQKNLPVPVRQMSAGDDPEKACFEVGSGDNIGSFYPELETDRGNPVLVADVAHFLRIPSPFNRMRTLTLCSGLFSLGTYGVVRALTDSRFRDQNEEYLRERFAGSAEYSILMRIAITNGIEALTPDWSEPSTRLYEWPKET